MIASCAFAAEDQLTASEYECVTQFKHLFDGATAQLCVRTDDQGSISIAVIGVNKKTMLPIWIWAGADAWHSESEFIAQRKPYRSADAAKLHAETIYPTRDVFDRFLRCGVNGVTITAAERLRFGEPFTPASWTDSTKTAATVDISVPLTTVVPQTTEAISAELPTATATVLSANVNGLQRAVERGFFDLPHVQAATVLCLQETRCDDAESIGRELGYHAVATDRGIDVATGKRLHGGVAIFSRSPISDSVRIGHAALAPRGQFVSCRVRGVRIASVYVTLDGQEQFTALGHLFNELLSTSEPALACGDMNTFRNERDSWSFHDSFKKRGYGCDPTAMKWFSESFSNGWSDALEEHHKIRPLYTWWSRNDLFERKSGTRVDYILASPSASRRITPGTGEVYTSQRFGGHAQIAIGFDFGDQN